MINWEINGYPLSYVVWNLILGLVPFFLSYFIFRLEKNKKKTRKIYQLALFFLWLIFLPNIPYILTEVRHINGFCENTILDICAHNAFMIVFFFLYSLISWIFYFYAVEQMVFFIRKNVSRKIAFYFPIMISPIISLGLLLGLVDRLNTWDVIFRPSLILRIILTYFTITDNFFNLIIFTICLLLMYYIGKIVFKPISSIGILNKIIN